MHSLKYSYIDKSGRVIIDATNYESAGNFHDGLAAVCSWNGSFGFIDASGSLLIEPQFYSTLGFSDGLAAVCTGDKWGFIDKKGHVVIEARFDVVCSFFEGVAVGLIDDTVLLINRSGQPILSRSMNDLQLNIYEDARYSEGLIAAYDPREAKYGFIDRMGEYVIEPKYEQAAPFSEGLARVMVVEGQEKLGFIDRSGQFVIPPKFNTDADFRRNSTDFSEGLASVTEGLSPTIIEEAKFVYINKRGEIVLPTDFFYAGSFNDGMAVVYDEERDKWGYIDKSGKIVIPLQFNLASDFSDGLACVAT